jgi:hypothetical protein
MSHFCINSKPNFQKRLIKFQGHGQRNSQQRIIEHLKKKKDFWKKILLRDQFGPQKFYRFQKKSNRVQGLLAKFKNDLADVEKRILGSRFFFSDEEISWWEECFEAQKN